MDKSVKTKENLSKIYHETKVHTDTMFALNIYLCTIPQDFSSVSLHWQDEIEIIYVKKGTGKVTLDLNVYEAHAGDVFVVLPGHIHGMQKVAGERMEYENIIFDKSFLGSQHVDICSQKYLQPLLNDKLSIPGFLHGDDLLHRQVKACLDSIDKLCEYRPNGYELGVKGQMLTAFSFLFQHASETEGFHTAKRNEEKLKNVLRIMERDFDKKLSVEEMAAGCGYSASHFMRWFRDITGYSFHAYLVELRLNRAADALLHGEDSVVTVAAQTGFDNLSNFNRLFKKRFGMTPSQFRKQSL